jgi:hypothetical protein
MNLFRVFFLSLFCSILAALPTLHAQGTAFTYQGRLSNGGVPVNGSFDLAFSLYPDASSLSSLAGPVTNNSVVVTNGLFTTLVDFGPGVFVGGSNWLAISVSSHGANSFGLLSPRQQVTPTPYALKVVGSVNTSQLLGSIPASSISGTLTLAQLPAGVVTNTSPSLSIGGTNAVAPLTVPPTLPLSAIGSLATGGSIPSIAVAGRYAYVVNSSLATLQVIDVSNPSAPVSIGSVATAGTPFSVTVAGRYAYIANSGSQTLQIFDVSNPSAPLILGSVATGSGPFFVTVAGRHAYVANATANTLQIFDLGKPAAPVVVGSVGTGAHPSSIAVAGRYAFVVNGSGNTLQVFDVGNPSAPVSVGSTATSSSPNSIAVVGRYAYVANAAGTLQVFDVSTPSTPLSVGSAATKGIANSISVAGRFAYVANAGVSSAQVSLQVFDVSTPAAPLSVGSVPAASNPNSLAVAGRYAYVVNSVGTLQVFDVGGAYLQNLEAGAIETGTLQTRDTVTVGNNLDVRGGATVSGSARISGGLGVDSINATGAVGIGTSSPVAPLDVEISSASSHGNWGYLNLSGFVNNGGLGFTGGASMAIYAFGNVGAITYYAFSDARIKNVVGRSDSASDLKTLLALKVTDYTYKDTVAHGVGNSKKLIAQEVESVYPQAVSRTRGVVPDIFQQASHHDGWITLTTNLKVGDRVKLLGENDQGVYEVLETRDDAFRTNFKPATEKVFVYGREVDDLRSVDYEAIAMLNASATQELSRKIDSQDAELKRLTGKLSQALAEKETLLKYLSRLEARDQEREERLTRLEGSLDKSPARARYATLPK